MSRFFPLSLSRACSLLALCAAATAPLPGHANIVFSERFPDNTRNRQSPPDSLAWFSTAGSTLIGVADNKIGVASAIRSGNSAIAYFPAVELNTRQSLKLTLKFEPTVNIQGTILYPMMVGLLDSNGGERITADGENPGPVNYRGYAVPLNYNAESTGRVTSGYYLRVLKRDQDKGNIITSTAGFNIIANRQNQPAAIELQSGTTYDFAMTITRVSATQVDIDAVVSGGNLREPIRINATDNANPCVRFDTIGLTAFFSRGNAPGGFPAVRYSDIRLELGR